MSPGVSAEDVDQYLDITAGYSRGEFSPGVVSSLNQIQVTYGAVKSGSDYSVTVPYLYLHDELGDTSGMGDIVMRAGKKLDNNTAEQKGLYGSVAIKLPTASETKGLGTGEIDLGGFLSYTLGLKEINLTMMGGYVLTGDSSSQAYEDIFVYGLGLSKHIYPWYVYGSFEGRQQTLTTGSDALEFNAGLFYQLKTTQFLKAEGYIGLNSDVQDYGISIGIVNWF